MSLLAWFLGLVGTSARAALPPPGQDAFAIPPRPVAPPRSRAYGFGVAMANLTAGDRRQGESRPSAWQVAKPMPGVVPEGMALDTSFDRLYSYAAEATWGGGEGLHWLGYPYLAELAQRSEYRRLSETIAREMTRKWVRIVSSGDEDKTDRIKVIEKAFDRLKVQARFRRIAELDGFFGRAHLFIDVGTTDDDDELKTPLARRPAKVRRKSLKRLVVVEPQWTYPNIYNATDPLDPHFYRPRTWFVQGRQVHQSRLLTFVSREVPDILKPAYAFGGLSMSQMAMPYVNNWLRTRQSVSDMLHSYSVSGIKTNLNSMIDSDPDEVLRKSQWLSAMRDNRNVLLLDKDSEDYFNVASPLAGLDHLQAQAQEQMASVSGIPLIVLLGITPSGLNASSEGELRAFYAWVESMQEQLFTDKLRAVLDLVQLSECGDIDPDIGIKWVPLWQLDDAALAGMRKTQADTAAEYISAGVLSPLEERRRLAEDEDTPYPGLDIEDLPQPPGQPGEEADPFAPGGEDPNQPPGQPGAPPAPPAAPAPRPQQPGQAASASVVPFRKQVAGDAFNEGDHPRDEGGEFTSGGSSSRSSRSSHTAGMVAREPGQPVPAHVEALRIPPAWTNVRYATDPKAALLATGRDSKGRRTAIYSAEFHAQQAATKFARVQELMGKFADVQQQNEVARRSKDPATRDAADCLALIMQMGIRPGSESDTKAETQAFGATTLEGRHVVALKSGVRLRFTGKKGVALDLTVADPKLAKMLTQRAESAGRRGKLFPATSAAALREHARSLDGGGFHPKDFRTRVGTSTALRLVADAEAPADAKSYRKAVMGVAKQVASVLGNTPAIALAAYISPTVFSDWRAAIAA